MAYVKFFPNADTLSILKFEGRSVCDSRGGGELFVYAVGDYRLVELRVEGQQPASVVIPQWPFTCSKRQVTI